MWKQHNNKILFIRLHLPETFCTLFASISSDYLHFTICRHQIRLFSICANSESNLGRYPKCWFIQKIWMGFHMWKEYRVFSFKMWKYAMADYKISSYHVIFLLPKSQKCLEKSHKIVSFWKSMLWSVYETKITCFLLKYRFWSSPGWILPINTKNFKKIPPPKDYFLQGS